MASAPGVLIGVDIGSTSLSGGIVTGDGTILKAVETLTQGDGPGTALEVLLRVVGELVRHATERGLPVDGIGIGLPGIVDSEAGAMLKGINCVPELGGFSLAERIRAETGIAAWVDNDVNALGLAESTWGRGRGAASLVVLAVGSGVGGAIILDGHLLRGRNGHAGELGHVTVNLDGRLCLCGARGCLGAYAAGYGIAVEAARRAGRASAPVPPTPGQGNDWDKDAAAVFRAADRGDAVAREVIGEACHALGAALGGLVNSLNPEVIVVTGGVMKSLVAHERQILDHARDYALADALEGTRIHLVPGDKSQTVRGGAALVLYERGRRPARPSR